MGKALARVLRTILAGLDEPTPAAPCGGLVCSDPRRPGQQCPSTVVEELRDIRENHLAHIYTALGKLEGKMAILLGVSGMILMTVIGTVASNLLR